MSEDKTTREPKDLQEPLIIQGLKIDYTFGKEDRNSCQSRKFKYSRPRHLSRKHIPILFRC
jgi:hypothetical protein